MSIEQIQNFLTVPNLPDIITYVLYGILLIAIAFLKAFVKRDNKRTMFSVDNNVAKLHRLEKDLEQKTKELDSERKRWERERTEMRKELEVVKKAIRTSSNNSHELVSNGTAAHIAQMLPLNDKEEIELQGGTNNE